VFAYTVLLYHVDRLTMFTTMIRRNERKKKKKKAPKAFLKTPFFVRIVVRSENGGAKRSDRGKTRK